MERTRNTVSAQLQLREAHQACAAESAVTGAIPSVFRGDPTFAELVVAKKDEKKGEGSRA